MLSKSYSDKLKLQASDALREQLAVAGGAYADARSVGDAEGMQDIACQALTMVGRYLVATLPRECAEDASFLFEDIGIAIANSSNVGMRHNGKSPHPLLDQTLMAKKRYGISGQLNRSNLPSALWGGLAAGLVDCMGMATVETYQALANHAGVSKSTIQRWREEANSGLNPIATRWKADTEQACVREGYSDRNPPGLESDLVANLINETRQNLLKTAEF